jgi:hypothetical protein
MEPNDLIGLLNTGMILTMIITFGIIIEKIIFGNQDLNFDDPYKALYRLYKERYQDLLIIIGISVVLLLSWLEEMI